MTGLLVKRLILLIGLLATFYISATGAQGDSSTDLPQFTSDNRLMPPEHYREWIFLASGFGMTYNPASANVADPPFDNVFVNPPAYKSFLKTGSWPDGTIFVLEIRASVSKGSINQGGHFQNNEVHGLEVHVRDEQRFPGGWAFYDVISAGKPASALPRSTSCYSCHSSHGAVDTTFVQFYPTLIDIAKQKGTFKLAE